MQTPNRLTHDVPVSIIPAIYLLASQTNLTPRRWLSKKVKELVEREMQVVKQKELLEGD